MSPLGIVERKIVDNEAMKNLGDLKLSVKEARRVYPENRKIVQRNSQFALEEPESHKWYLFRSIFSVF